MIIPENIATQSRSPLSENNQAAPVILGKFTFLGMLKSLARGLMDLVETVGGISGKAIVSTIEKYFPNTNNWKVTGDENLPPADQNKLNDWDVREYRPFYIKLSNDFGKVFSTSNLNDQLIKANLILNKICAYKKYMITNPNGNNTQAHSVQNNYVTNTLNAIETLITQNLDASNSISLEYIKINSDVLELPFARKLGTIECANYVSKNAANTVPIKTNQVPIVVNGEVLDIPVQTTDGTFINPATGNIVANPNKKTLIIPGIAIVLLLAALLSGRKKK